MSAKGRVRVRAKGRVRVSAKGRVRVSAKGRVPKADAGRQRRSEGGTDASPRAPSESESTGWDEERAKRRVATPRGSASGTLAGGEHSDKIHRSHLTPDAMTLFPPRPASHPTPRCMQCMAQAGPLWSPCPRRSRGRSPRTARTGCGTKHTKHGNSNELVTHTGHVAHALPSFLHEGGARRKPHGARHWRSYKVRVSNRPK